MNSKLPILFPKKTRETKPGCYLISVDVFQKEKHSFTGEDGKDYTLYTPRDQTNNIKDRNPNIAIIEAAFGETDFIPGQIIIIDHFVVQNHDKSSNHIYEDETGKKYWKVENYDVFACLKDGNVIPNTGILLCEYVEDKLVETNLELPDSMIDKRQDLAKIIYSSDDRYPAGKFIIVEDYALYEIEYNGKKYAKVDINMHDIVAVTDSPDWRKEKILNMKLSEVKEPV